MDDLADLVAGELVDVEAELALLVVAHRQRHVLLLLGLVVQARTWDRITLATLSYSVCNIFNLNHFCRIGSSSLLLRIKICGLVFLSKRCYRNRILERQINPKHWQLLYSYVKLLTQVFTNPPLCDEALSISNMLYC